LYFGLPEQPTNLLWLAVYNLSSLNYNKCKALKGRSVYLFPDLSKNGKAFELWSSKAKELQKRLQGTYFKVSDLLEQLAPEQDKEQGRDIADYIIKQDWRKFRKQELKPSPKPNAANSEKSEKCEALQQPFFSQIEDKRLTKVNRQNLTKLNLLESEPQNWNKDISDLESYFAKVEFPTKPVQLNECTVLTDCSFFVDGSLTIIKANNGNSTFLPYLNRLKKLKEILNN